MAVLDDIRTEKFLVARKVTEPDLLSDPRLLAWEIVRRRADYQGQSGLTDALSPRAAGASLEVLHGVVPVPPWGLQFCRRSRTPPV